MKPSCLLFLLCLTSCQTEPVRPVVSYDRDAAKEDAYLAKIRKSNAEWDAELSAIPLSEAKNLPPSVLESWKRVKVNEELKRMRTESDAEFEAANPPTPPGIR
jgi:hypothetical protein